MIFLSKNINNTSEAYLLIFMEKFWNFFRKILEMTKICFQNKHYFGDKKLKVLSYEQQFFKVQGFEKNMSLTHGFFDFCFFNFENKFF